MSRKLTVDFELLEDLAASADILFNIAVKKNLTDQEIERLMYVNKLLTSCNELLKKAISEK